MGATNQQPMIQQGPAFDVRTGPVAGEMRLSAGQALSAFATIK